MTDADVRRCAYLVVGRFLSDGNYKNILTLVNDVIGFGAPEGVAAVRAEVERIRDAMLAAGAVRDG